MKYIVKKNPTDLYHYVEGLDNDAVLIFRYPEGDIDTCMLDRKMMHGALYDLFQWHPLLKDGDTFETEFGNFICSDIHVFIVPRPST